MTRRRPIAIVLALAVSLTCKDATAPPMLTVTVSGPAALELGDSVQVTAQARRATGEEVFTQRTWRSTNPAVATIDPNGLVRARGLGTTNIQATVEGSTGTRALNVIPVIVASVRVTPAADSILLGDSLQLVATAIDARGGTIPGRAVVWSSPDTARGTVSASGMARARTLESFVIHAVIEGKTGGAFLRGQEPIAVITLPDTAHVLRGSAVTFVPALFGASGTPITGRTLTWTVTDTAAATVSPLGTLTGLRPDTTTLIASCCGGVADSSVVVIHQRPVQLLSINFSHDSVIPGRPVRASAFVYDDRFQLQAAPVTWIPSDTSILAVIPDSADSRAVTLRGIRPGTVRLHATSGDARDSARVRVVLPLGSLTLEPDSVVVRAGSHSQTHAVWRDIEGAFRSDAYSTFRSLDTSIATVGGSIVIPAVTGVRPGTTAVIARANIDTTVYEDTAVVVVLPTAAPRLRWNVAEQFVEAFRGYDMTLTLTDSAGAPLPSPMDVTITAADTSVSVSPSFVPGLNGATPITLTGRAAGRITITARTDSLFASFLLQVVRFGVDSVRFTAPALLEVGDSVTLTAVVHGSSGSGGDLPYPARWSVSDSSIATVTPVGVLVGQGPGRVTIVATSFEGADTAMVTVHGTGAVALDSVRPQRLVAGGTATLWGTGFAASPVANTVLIDGVAASILAVGSGNVTVQLPPVAAFPCREVRPVIVSIAAGTGLSAQAVDLEVATSLTLAVGEAAYLADPARGSCLELPMATGAPQYGIAVVHAIASAAAVTPVTITGRTPGAAVAVAQAFQAPELPPARTDIPGLARSRKTAQVHQAVHEENRRFAASVGAPAPLLRAQLRQMSSVTDSINDRVRIRIPNVTRPDFCVNHTSITARKAYVGTRVVIYEDVASVYAGGMDDDYARLGAEFDSVMYPLLRTHYGDPLVLDSLLDGNGRISMVFSPLVNQTGAAGFVVSCDFYPETVAPSSNTGETFYAIAPTSTATFFAPGTRQEWNWLIRSVVMHEAKHITAVAERLSRGGPLEQSWLEEASAVLAEELWSRSIYGTTWKGNALYNQTIACDVRPLQCPGRPYSMFNAFAFLYDYAVANETLTPLGRVSGADGSFYGSAWLWLRWLIDHNAATESAFLTALTQDVSRSGVDHFGPLSPDGWPRLLADWALANQVDDNPTYTVPPQQRHPSWSLSDIFAGMSADFPSFFTMPAPFRMRVSAFGTFGHTIGALRGGTASVLRIQGNQTQPQLVEIKDPRGPTSVLRVEVVRLRD